MSNLALLANFLLTIILARLLSPQDIGIFSMAAVLMAVAHVFRDFGVTTYIKREKELTATNLRNALGVLLATSWSVAIGMYLSAPYWANFFHEDGVTDVVRVLALGFVFIPFGAIPTAILSREMAVEKSAQVTAVSTSVYFIASIAFAANGFGPMTMAWANLINILASGLMARYVLSRPLPVLPSFSEIKAIIHFGAGNLITALLKAADNALPDVLLGRYMNASAVGLFSRANSTVNMVGTALHPTVNYFALPYLAKLHHANGPIASEYLRATSLINSLMLPSLAVIAVLAHDVVSVLYGNAWLGAVSSISWLCLAYAISSVFTLSAPALAGVGKPYASIAPQSLVLLGKILSAAILFDGTLASFAKAIAIGQMSSIPLYLWIHHRHLGLNWIDWARWTMPLVVHAAIVGLVGLGVRISLPPNISTWSAVVATSTFAAAAAITAYFILRLPISKELVGLTITLINSRKR